MLAYAAVGLAHLIDAQPATAREALGQSIPIARDRRSQRGLLPSVLAALAEAHLALGARTEALATAREGIDLARAGGGRYFEAQAQLALAAALLATDGLVPRAEIESALARADRLVESIEGRALSPRILDLRGRLAARSTTRRLPTGRFAKRWSSTGRSAPPGTPSAARGSSAHDLEWRVDDSVGATDRRQSRRPASLAG